MISYNWQKSSYCGSGESCLHVASEDRTVRITESSDPEGVILRTTVPALGALLHAIERMRTGATRV
ncbi:DUF397 domain-containing protein [Streptomyces sp. NPDC051320]|uniref:DUF397 domain-containing protein n=1 Tax=Streptomyces sp. NPDC051320 TaxID=3154644 RepID=UPI00342B5D44